MHFIESHGGKQAFTGLRSTTTSVCNRFLKPSTVDKQASYCVAFKDDPTRSGHINQATAFVSHAWGHDFLDVVAALEDYDSRQPTPTVFWFDIFSNNQHKAPDREFSWWQTVFRDNIGKLKRTLLVLEWDDPKPLSRAWCLWEMVSTVNTGSEFHVLMSRKNHESFATALVKNLDGIVFKTCNVDLRSAQAFKPSDRDNIFKAVEATAGFDEVNKVVIGIMGKWMVESGKEAISGLSDEERAISTLQGNLARFLYRQRKLDEAESLYGKALELKRRILGNTHPDTLSNINNLGLLLKHQGKLDEAEPLVREALEGLRRTHGDNDRNTLASLANLASLIQAQGKLDEAEPLFREALKEFRRTLGDTNPDTLTSIDNLAMLLQAQGKLDGAEPLYRKALTGRRRALGDSHPDTLTSINNLGLLLKEQGKLDDAEPLMQKALEGRRRTLGDTHPDTLISICSLGMLLQDQGKLNEAEPLLREDLEGSRRTLGNTHPNTLISVYNLALLFEAQGKLSEAEPLYREAVSGARQTLGDKHPNTLIMQKNLDLLLQKMGKV